MSATAETEVMELAIQIKGEIVNSNFEAFKARCLERIEGMKYELLTDDDFSKAKEDIKNLQTTEKALKTAEEDALKQMGDVYELIDGIREIQKASASCRLDKSREVKKRDAEIKANIIEDALAKIDHPKRDRYRADVSDGAKGKRTFKTMAQGADKVAELINTGIGQTREALDHFEDEHGKTLIPDRVELELQSADGVVSELHYRLEKQRDEEEKARLKAQLDAERKEAEKLAKERELENKESSQGSIEADSGNESAPLRKDETDLRNPSAGSNSRSGNYFDKRKVEPVSESGLKAVAEMAESGLKSGQSIDEEWNQFLADVPSVFLQFREKRLALTHPENQAKALTMAEAVNQAYIEMKTGAGLLAAASKMLEALQNIENDDNHIPDKIWNMIQSAISRAIGKEVS